MERMYNNVGMLSTIYSQKPPCPPSHQPHIEFHYTHFLYHFLCSPFRPWYLFYSFVSLIPPFKYVHKSLYARYFFLCVFKPSSTIFFCFVVVVLICFYASNSQWCSQFNDNSPSGGKTQIPIRLIVPASQCGSLIGQKKENMTNKKEQTRRMLLRIYRFYFF